MKMKKHKMQRHIVKLLVILVSLILFCTAVAVVQMPEDVEQINTTEDAIEHNPAEYPEVSTESNLAEEDGEILEDESEQTEPELFELDEDVLFYPHLDIVSASSVGVTLGVHERRQVPSVWVESGVSWGSPVFSMTVDGRTRLIYCLEPLIHNPPAGGYAASVLAQNSDIAQALYYMWGAPGASQLFTADRRASLPGSATTHVPGFGDVGTEYTVSHLILGYLYAGREFNNRSFRNLNQVGRDMVVLWVTWLDALPSAPHANKSFNNANLTASIDVAGGFQVTPFTTFHADHRNQITIPLQTGVWAERDSGGSVTRHENNVTLHGGDRVRFGTNNLTTVPAGRWTSVPLHGSNDMLWRALIFNEGGDTQTLGGLDDANDSVQPINISITWQDTRGSLRINKTVEHWHTLEGFEVEVHRASDNHLIGQYTTPISGEIYIPNLLLGDYIITEIVQSGFVAPTPNPRTVTVVPGHVGNAATSTTFNNIRQRGTITVTKLDQDTGDRAQGEATLSGAIFDIYDTDNALVATLDTGNTNTATSQPLPLDTYYVVERTEPHGYTNSNYRHRIELTHFAPHVAIGNADVTVYNRVIQGRIAVVKFSDIIDQSNPQIMRPLEGAIFEVFLSSASSFENARPTERALITTNSDGFAETPQLPFGQYTVKETHAPGDVRLVDPFDVTINEDGRTYYYILDNPAFMSLVRVVKVDSTTGEKIQIADVEFRIWDVDNQRWVEQRINYPTPITISTFRTDKTGQLILPLPLLSGDYELHEISAPNGYILSNESIPFRIHSSLAGDDDAIEVVFANDPVMGIISVEKRGNMLTSVEISDTQFGTQHTPIFSLTGLPGVEFNVIAAEDIITPDGTVRYEAGEIVDTIITDEDGYAESQPLFLGSYYVVEVSAYEGFALDDTARFVTLSYADQYTPIVHESLSLENKRQRISIELEKWMEPFDGETSPFDEVVFGVFADENVYAIDGELVIEVDDLIALITLDDNGCGILEIELPWASFVARELKTAVGYVIDEVAFEFIVAPAEQEVAVIIIEVNDGEAINNYLVRGDLEVPKTGDDTQVPWVRIIITISTIVVCVLGLVVVNEKKKRS